jgi:hypothetical protein
VLAIVALRGAHRGLAVTRGRLALGLAAAHLILAAILFTLLRDKLVELFRLLNALG